MSSDIADALFIGALKMQRAVNAEPCCCTEGDRDFAVQMGRAMKQRLVSVWCKPHEILHVFEFAGGHLWRSRRGRYRTTWGRVR